MKLNNIDEEILSNLGQEEIENNFSESAKVFEIYHVLMVRVTLKLKSIKINDSNKDSAKSLNQSKCVLHKLESPVFNGNSVEWQSFCDQYSISIHRHKGLCDIDRLTILKNNCLAKH